MTKKSSTQFSLFRRYLLTGLAFLAPLVLTVFLFVYLFQLVHNFIGKPIDRVLSERVGGEWLGWVGSLLGFLIVLALILVIGAIASTVIGRRLFTYGERLLLQLPLIRTVYAPAKQIVEFFVNPNATQFSAVVLVRYPHPNSYAIGFITARDVDAINTATGKRLVNVFVPFTPTPVTGTLLLLPEEELIPVDLTVEEALKMVVSGGVVTPMRPETVAVQNTDRP